MATYVKDKLDGLRHKPVSVEDFQVAAEDPSGFVYSRVAPADSPKDCLRLFSACLVHKRDCY
jgi:hypothetical protein